VSRIRAAPLVEKQIDYQAKAHSIAREKVISDEVLKNQPNKRFVEVAERGALALSSAPTTARP
jgi:3-hydroxybutyrate dehydrogenase